VEKSGSGLIKILFPGRADEDDEKNFSKISWTLKGNLYPGLPTCEAEVLIPLPQHLVTAGV
jgi:hypothetical protein